MTGPEHYREAERLVAHSKHHTDQGNGADDKIAELAAAQAQVHATLALASATASGRFPNAYVPSAELIDLEPWRATL